MIHECNEPLVPLSREIKLIQDYIGLEKVRYGNRLNMQIEIEGEFEHRQIAPLLLIPFVENSFKHGASVMRGEQWIRLHICVSGERLDFNLANSKPPEASVMNNKNGIGLANVQKRLQLLYPDNHFLNIETANDTYKVQLGVSLLNIPDQGNPMKLIPKLQPA
jgi:LytS/YehU family sensor histidine kinase